MHVNYSVIEFWLTKFCALSVCCCSFKRSSIISSIYSVFGKKEPDFIARDSLSRNLIARNRLFSEQRQKKCLRNMVGVVHALNAKYVCVCVCARVATRQRPSWEPPPWPLGNNVRQTRISSASACLLAWRCPARIWANIGDIRSNITDHVQYKCNHWITCWKEYNLFAHHEIAFRSKRA